MTINVKLFFYRETILLDPTLIWTSDDIGENMKTYAEDFSKMKGREKDDVLIKFYNETAHAKKSAVWYVFYYFKIFWGLSLGVRH